VDRGAKGRLGSLGLLHLSGTFSETSGQVRD
jgi:hypothetical protein